VGYTNPSFGDEEGVDEEFEDFINKVILEFKIHDVEFEEYHVRRVLYNNYNLRLQILERELLFRPQIVWTKFNRVELDYSSLTETFVEKTVNVSPDVLFELEFKPIDNDEYGYDDEYDDDGEIVYKWPLYNFELLSRLQTRRLKCCFDKVTEDYWGALDESIGRMAYLQELIYWRSGSFNYKVLFRELHNLKKLTLDICGGKSYRDVYKLPQSLEFLEINSEQQPIFSCDLSEMNNLKHLSIIINNSYVFGIEELVNLEYLELEGCYIESMDSLTKLINLTSLKLHNSTHTKLPNGIGNMKKLVTLELGSTSIEKIPEYVSEFQNLRHLSLAFNQIEAIPEYISELKNLTRLNLAFNQIEEIPKYISELQNLTHLNLRNNQISLVPKYLDNLKGIYFNLRYNKIEVIPKWLETSHISVDYQNLY
jgi:Leucine-rich repeat (LRR) protein